MSRIETLASLLASILVGWLACNAVTDFTASDIKTVAGTMAGVTTTLLGFVIAALSILVAVSDKPLLSNMRKSGHYQALLRRMFWTSAALSLSAASAVLALFMTQSDAARALVLAAAAFGGACVVFASSARKFFLVTQFLD